MNKTLWLLYAGLLLLTACATTPPPPRTVDVEDFSAEPAALSKVPNAQPGVEPRTYTVRGKQYEILDSSDGFVQRGVASYYATRFQGRRTSSGEKYDMYEMTAAHKSLPFSSYAEVTNLANGRRVIVKVNDRGPFHGKRVIDLSFAAAVKLGITQAGTGKVEIRAIDPDTMKTARPGKNEPVDVKAGNRSQPADAKHQEQTLQAERQEVRTLAGTPGRTGISDAHPFFD